MGWDGDETKQKPFLSLSLSLWALSRGPGGSGPLFGAGTSLYCWLQWDSGENVPRVFVGTSQQSNIQNQWGSASHFIHSYIEDLSEYARY